MTTVIKARELRDGDYIYLLDDQGLVEDQFRIEEVHQSRTHADCMIAWAEQDGPPILFDPDDDVTIDNRP